MGEKQKNNVKKSRAFLIALFFAFAISIFLGNYSKAQAASCACGDGVIVTTTTRTLTANTAADCNTACAGSGYYQFNNTGGWISDTASTGSSAPAANSCFNGTKDASGNCTCDATKGLTKVNGNCVDNTAGTPNNYNQNAGTATDLYGGTAANTVTCSDDTLFGMECTFKMLLYGIFTFFGWILTAATTLFAWTVDAKNISGPAGVLNNKAISDVWVMVRDTLNMFFILVLLFAAFCTIFQVEKWNLKKVWLNVLINALLVNFSFTIARFIMDIANVMMYYFFANMFGPSMQSGGSAIMAAYGGASGIANILIPQGSNLAGASWAFLIAATVFLFIFAVTLMVVAAMFVIRLIALAIIVMFSPVGFVGYIFPATSKFADNWWSSLFKYSFFGPIMAFMMAVSLQMMNAFGSANLASSMQADARLNVPTGSSVGPNWIASVAFYLIPIIILWVAMGISQSLGISGAGAVVGSAKKWSNTALQGAKWAAYKNPVARGVKEGVKERSGINGLVKWWKSDSRVEAAVKGGIIGAGRPDGFAGGAQGGWRRTGETQHNKDVAEEEKKMEDLRRSDSELKQMVDPANHGKYKKSEIEAAARILSKRESFKDGKELNNALSAIAAANSNPEIAAEKKAAIVKKADKNLFKDANEFTDTIAHLGNDFKTISQLIDKTEGDAFKGMSVAQYSTVSSTDSGVKAGLDRKLKKEGKTDVLVSHAITPAGGGKTRSNAVNDILKDMKTEDVAKQDMFKTGNINRLHAKVYVNGQKVLNPNRYQKIMSDLK